MFKGFFFGLPSVSVNKTLAPVIDRIVLSGYEMVYYNTAEFIPTGAYHFDFKAYPYHFSDYRSYKIDESTSYFQFAEILVNSAGCLMDFLCSEIETKKPDFIIYSHLALWGRLIARHYKLPAITLNTTFILDKRIMLPFFRRMNASKSLSFNSVNKALELHRKSVLLYSRLRLQGNPDPWDVYINKGELNIAFILKEFQPKKELFGDDYKFIGFPAPLRTSKTEKKVIYVSMGTIMNGDISFYRLCIAVLKDIKISAIISVGSKVDMQQLDEPPKHIKLVHFIDQRAVLMEALLFITHGGMASVHEAVYSLTPMIVIPKIPEQQLTALRIEELGVGTHLPANQLTEGSLRAAIGRMLTSQTHFAHNLDKLTKKMPAAPSEEVAAKLITNFVAQRNRKRKGRLAAS